MAKKWVQLSTKELYEAHHKQKKRKEGIQMAQSSLVAAQVINEA